MDRSDRFEDIFSVVDVGLFIESPSRLIPYMRHHGFDEKEILCVKTIADSHPDELSDIIGDEDPRKAEATIARVARTPGVDRIISASILQDLRDASNVKMKRDAFSSKKYEPVCVDAYSNGGRPASDDMMFVIVPDGEAKVDRYSGNDIDIVIPDVINFGGEEYTVTGINEWAFERCSSMESVRLPSMLASIGEKAFVGCSRLKSVTIPKHLKAIGKDAFEKCPGLEWFAVDRENRHFSTDSQGILYSEDKKRLIKAPCGVSGEIWIPLEVTSIEDKAFEGCSELSRVSMGPGVSSIGDWAFSKCFHLRSVALSDGLVAIGNGNLPRMLRTDGDRDTREREVHRREGVLRMLLDDERDPWRRASLHREMGVRALPIPDVDIHTVHGVQHRRRGVHHVHLAQTLSGRFRKQLVQVRQQRPPL